MTKEQFIESAQDWAKVVNPDYASHLKVCKEEYRELIEAVAEYVKASRQKVQTPNYRLHTNAKKEYCDVLWTLAILQSFYQPSSFTDKMQLLLDESRLFEDSEMLSAVSRSNWSKFIEYRLLTNSEAGAVAEAIESKYKGRYSNVTANNNGHYWFFTDQYGKVLKPLNYQDYTEFI